MFRGEAQWCMQLTLNWFGKASMRTQIYMLWRACVRRGRELVGRWGKLAAGQCGV